MILFHNIYIAQHRLYYIVLQVQALEPTGTSVHKLALELWVTRGTGDTVSACQTDRPRTMTLWCV